MKTWNLQEHWKKSLWKFQGSVKKGWNFRGGVIKQNHVEFPPRVLAFALGLQSNCYKTILSSWGKTSFCLEFWQAKWQIWKLQDFFFKKVCSQCLQTESYEQKINYEWPKRVINKQIIFVTSLFLMNNINLPTKV